VSARLRRARRLVELAEGEERAARARTSEAERAVAAARLEADRAEAAWLEATCVVGAAVTRAFELEEREAFLRTLRARADAAAKRVEAAAIEERRLAAELVRAATERRKLELWRDRITEGERDEDARKERVASDEMAARIVLRSRP
jgi:flagellar biosynthesis chaperone FliJ